MFSHLGIGGHVDHSKKLFSSHKFCCNSQWLLIGHYFKCCDNGPNFAGAKQELINAFNEMDHTKIQGVLQNRSADWIKWKRKKPAASHKGILWECQSLSARGILASLLQTLMAKTKAVINSWPLTVKTINDGQGFKPLSPNNLLTTKSKVVMPWPGVFQRLDSDRDREGFSI